MRSVKLGSTVVGRRYSFLQWDGWDN